MGESAKLMTKTPDAKRENSVSHTREIERSQSRSSPVDRILFFQRTIGNQAVQRLLQTTLIQAKLTISQPSDTYEQEAGRVAEQVMRMPVPLVQRLTKSKEGEKNPDQTVGQPDYPLVQRQVDDEEEEERLQTKAASGQTPQVAPNVQASITVLRGGGQPLPDSARAFFEPRFRYDFSQVRVHTDSQAAETAQVINAQAFTVGQDVVFGGGQYAPTTSVGKQLMAHELAHVIQQSGRIDRQRAATPTTPSGMGWNHLPAIAQQVLKFSWRTRQRHEWIWQARANPRDCFDATPSDHKVAFYNVFSKLSQQGLWSSVVRRVSGFWPKNTQGISFEPVGRQSLVTRLSNNLGFCRDKWIGGGSKDRPKCRQVVRTATPGLHIIIPKSGLCGVHIDMLAPIEGREPDGECNYDIYQGIHHWWKEEKGWRTPLEVLKDVFSYMMIKFATGFAVIAWQK
ncbi:MAG: DUF4157 domain-containing protein [bacterium]|nr:DUF4157 domain-containing protein [bacterium]